VGAVLVLAGAAVLAVALTGYLHSPAWQASHAEEVLPAATRLHGAGPPTGFPFARLRIQKIGLSVTVIEGTEPRDLLKAPGHLVGSALPGQPENCIIAGHRDLHFRHLGSLRPGDRVELEGANGTAVYQVESAQVIDPSKTSVLDPGDQPVLTLVTCYPFHYIGPAPRRFVVVARLVAMSGRGPH